MNLLLNETKGELINKINNDYRIKFKKKNWGRVKGGYLSSGNKIIIKTPKFDEKLSEFLGIMFGDGNSYFKKDYKVGVYTIRIVGDSRYEKEYLTNFVKPLAWELFGLKGKISYPKKGNSIILSFYSKEFVRILQEIGFPPGDKIRNKLKVPEWIRNNKLFLKPFIRGLIDTDESVFRMSNKDPQLIKISLTNFIFGFLSEIRNILLEIGFNPSKVISNTKIFLSRKEEIIKYVNETGFSNQKHINRLKVLQQYSPML